MKILVTGAAGNLGRALLEKCRGRHEVIGADVVEPPPEVAGADHVQFVRGDVFDELFFREVAAGCDAICHTAARHGGHLQTHTHEQFIQKNAIGADMMCCAMDDPLWPKLDVTPLRQLTGWEPQHSFDALLASLRAEDG